MSSTLFVSLLLALLAAPLFTLCLLLVLFPLIIRREIGEMHLDDDSDRDEMDQFPNHEVHTDE